MKLSDIPPIQFHWEETGSTVQINKGYVSNGLYLQSSDAYGYQREMVIRVENGMATIHSYMHPGMRHIETTTEKIAVAFINRLIERCTKYPNLLFNANALTQPKNRGFVHLHTQLLFGAELKDALLD